MYLLPVLRKVDLLKKPGSLLEQLLEEQTAHKSTIEDPDHWLPVRAVRILGTYQPYLIHQIGKITKLDFTVQLH